MPTHNMLQHQWTSDYTCNSPPDAVALFELEDPEASEPQSGETWPETYALIAPYEICGFLTFPASELCCVSSIDIVITSGYTSFMASEDKSHADNLWTLFPKAADGRAYCNLTSVSDGALFGYMSVFLLDGGGCYDGVLSCSEGILNVYDYNGTLGVDNGCVGDPIESFQLDASIQTLSSAVLYDFEGSTVVSSGASKQFSWTAYAPGNAIVARWKQPIEIAEAFAFAVAIFISTVYVVRTFHRVFIRKKRTIWTFSILFSNALMLLSTICKLIYVSTVFPETDEGTITLGWIGEFMNASEAFATLLIVIATTQLLVIPLLLKNMSPTYGKLLVALIVLLHFGLDGSHYLNYFYQTNYSVDFLHILGEWEAISPFWLLFTQIWDTVPAIMISLQFMDGTSSAKKKLKKLLKAEPAFFFYVWTQIMIFFSYVPLFYVTTHTEMLKNDVNYMATTGFFSLLVVSHTAATMRIDDVLRNFVKKSSTTSKSEFSSMNYYHATSLPIAGPDGSRVLLTKPQCPYCQKQFSRLLLVQNHTRICKLAPKLAKKEPQPAPVEEPVQTHILTKEEFLSQVFVGNSKQRMCPICQSKLNSKDEARYHWESKHAPSLTIVFHDGYTTDISKPECPRCRRQFKNLASTKFHAKNNCYGDGIAQVTSKADYDRLLENSDQKTCPICKASLGGDAQQHWELSHRQVFQITFEDDSTVEISEPQCPRCHKQFKTMMATRSHARKHCHWRPNTLIKEEMPRLIPRQIHITEPLTTDLPSESSDSPVNPLLMILEAAESLTMAKHHT
ncbi:hypothetical protein EDD86DRAFT_274483 [Gorgonomyces haynaldii]|nr:hypothetical protein EDD86DRAFT_274483 [Gorgonomyces haynaldii]